MCKGLKKRECGANCRYTRISATEMDTYLNVGSFSFSVNQAVMQGSDFM